MYVHHVLFCISQRIFTVFMVVGKPGSIPGATRFSIEELLERKSSCSGVEIRDYATLLYPQKLVLTSPTRGGLSIGIVRSRTKATELLLLLWSSVKYVGNIPDIKKKALFQPPSKVLVDLTFSYFRKNISV
jgi:hypothetical protein